jgi:hypothetical protein
MTDLDRVSRSLLARVDAAERRTAEMATLAAELLAELARRQVTP